MRRILPEDKVESVTGMSLTADGNGAVFDVKKEDVDTFLAAQENAAGVNIEVVKALPSLQERDRPRGRFGGGGGGRGRGGFGDRSGGNRFSGGRGGRGGGFSDRRNGSGGFKGRNNGNKW
ncbi:hypothetical protein POTOM_043509 [Populus tomentosa]|uniref:GUCT domain-containing protein n=1 Tax=Populus tomentosa TaxID=118781 RepID=A0A8X8C944_POPTO|nr:hypothetical protein POTOM_043509 [Populus tomentosa]